MRAITDLQQLELFTPDSPHNRLGLNGVEIFSNSSGSHHSLRKLDLRVSLVSISYHISHR